MEKTALITGITGQDGSYLSEILLGKGYRVHGIIRRASVFTTERIDHLYQDRHEENPKFFLHYGDLLDGVSLRRILSDVKPDEVYNLGAQSHVRTQFARGVLVEEIRFETGSHPHNLPALLTSTLDRTHDLPNVSALLKDKTIHLVTLIGTPGIGKTRLSIHCGNELLDDFPDGVWFVDLADVTNADFFIPTLARFLPSLSLPPSPSLDQLLSGLRDKRLLLILDNFEQIVEGASLDAAQILKTCPDVKILVTSRVPLHIYGEHEYPLPPLSIPPRDAKPTEEALTQFEQIPN